MTRDLARETPQRDGGAILAIALVFVLFASVVGAAASAYAVTSLRESGLRDERLRDIRVADGAMRIAVEKLRSPQTVVLGATTAGSTRLTAASSVFSTSDVGSPIAADPLEDGTLIAAYVSPTVVTLSTPALETATSTVVEFGDVECPTEPMTLLTTTIGGVDATVECVREPTVPGQFGQPAAVITGPDGLELKEEPTVISGDVYFTNPSSITLSKNLLVEDGDVWYPAAACPVAAPSIARLSFAMPTVQQYTCIETNVADKVSDVLDVPILPAVPGTAAASSLVNSCRVYAPGRYTTANRPDFDGEKNVYLRSGVYYFDNLGEVKIKDTVVTGGRPGAARSADDGEALWNGPCETAASSAAVNDTGSGVTIILGGSSRIRIEDKGGLELYEPATGASVVGLAAASGGYLASTGGTASAPQIDQRPSGSMMRIHGQVWLPSGYIGLGSPTSSGKTIDGLAPLGGQFLGGVVAYRLEITKKPPSGGYTLQSAHLDIIQRVLLVASAGSSSVRVVAEVRPAGDELAVLSWQESRDPTIAAAATQTLLTRPELAEESDSGVRDRVVTNVVTPLFTGGAISGTTVRIFADDVEVGSATAQNRRYLVRSRALTEGTHLVHAVSVDAGGAEMSTLPRVITIDRTPPTIAPADVAIVPMTNVHDSRFLGRSVAFYVYANATDPATVTNVTVDVSSIVAGATPAAMVAGDFSVDGVTYAWRSPLFGSPGTMTTTPKSILLRATDGAGNQSAAATVSLTVDTVNPTVSLTSPRSNAVLNNSTSFAVTTADAAAGIDSVRYEFSPAGANRWTAIGVAADAPYTLPWDTATVVAGSYDVRAVVYDRAGNTATSSSVRVRRN